MEWSRITFYVFLGLADCSVLTGIYEEKEIHSMTFSASILELEASLPSLCLRLRLISHLTERHRKLLLLHLHPLLPSFPVFFDLHVIDSGRSYPKQPQEPRSSQQ